MNDQKPAATVIQLSTTVAASMNANRSDLMTAQEASGRWCPFLRAQFERPTAKGILGAPKVTPGHDLGPGGNALVDEAGVVHRDAMSCAGPACSAFRWYRLFPGESPHGLVVDAGGNCAVLVAPDPLKPEERFAEPVGYCGLAGRPDASVPREDLESGKVLVPNRAARRGR